MRIWCAWTVVSTGGQFSEHRCPYWFATRREAVTWLARERREWAERDRKGREEHEKHGWRGEYFSMLRDSGIDLIDVPTTKRELIAWLDRWDMFCRPDLWPDPTERTHGESTG